MLDQIGVVESALGGGRGPHSALPMSLRDDLAELVRDPGDHSPPDIVRHAKRVAASVLAMTVDY